MKRIMMVWLVMAGCHHEQPASSGLPKAGSGSAAAGSGSAATAPTTAAGAVDEGMQMLVSTATAVVLGQSCAAQATALQSWADTHGDMMAKVREDLHKWPQAEIAAAVRDQLPKHTGIKPLMDAHDACAADSAFANVWERIYKSLE